MGESIPLQTGLVDRPGVYRLHGKAGGENGGTPSSRDPSQPFIPKELSTGRQRWRLFELEPRPKSMVQEVLTDTKDISQTLMV